PLLSAADGVRHPRNQGADEHGSMSPAVWPARGYHATLRSVSSLPGLPTPRLGRGHRAPYEPLAVSVRTGGSDSRVGARAGESSTGSPEGRSYEARAAARAAMSRTAPADPPGRRRSPRHRRA